MNLHISPQDGMPIYHQIRQQIKHLIASGRLRPGDELPPVRSLAQQLLINPNTVVRAYRELEVEGLIYKRRGAGTYVSEGNSPFAEAEQRKIIVEQIDKLLVETAQLRVDFDVLLQWMRERHHKLHEDGEVKE